MKKMITFCVALCATVAIYAQQQMATLNHNDSITAFYGSSALQQAHAAAVNGDVIVLSSGSFNAVNITKAVTILGAGMEYDSISSSEPTIISGNFTMTAPGNASQHLTLEGLQMISTIKYRTLSYPQFTKCMFNDLDDYCNINTQEVMSNATFASCIIKSLSCGGCGYKTTYIAGATFTNCAILNTDLNYSILSCNFMNCIIKMNNSNITKINTASSINAFTFSNSILFYNVTSNFNNNSASCYNCIGISCNSDSTINYFSNAGNGKYNFNNIYSVFKYFNGTYYDGVSFELQDSIAASILGIDNTEVGVYGGMVPYTPRVSPRFIRCNVAPHTTLDGKLSVDIEVVSE